MKNFLLEIGTEEMPASYIKPAADRMAEVAGSLLASANITPSNISSYATPRRFMLAIEGLPQQQEAICKKVSGPPVKAAFDKDGNPTKAAIGFAKKFGIEVADLQKEDNGKGEYLYAEVQEGGGKIEDILARLMPEVIRAMPFPKSMKWGSTDTKFARPLRSIIALLDGEIVNFSYDHIKSNRLTSGHRFLHDGSPVNIKTLEDYSSNLRDAFVIVKPEERRELITKGISALEAENGIKVISDEELLETVCYLTEYPVPVLGEFDKSYLDLPRELLMTVMKVHQKYFATEDEQGNITNRFIAISNIQCEQMEVLQKGYQRVLAARLSDARFFFDEDRKKKIADFAEKLSGITYMKRLGSMADKTSRISSIASAIANNSCPDKLSHVAKAASLCKADLTTAMVYEFPELQGIMGREYAKAENLPEDVAIAIDEHYKPRFSGDELPCSSISTAVALADKIDTICCFFGIGKRPTGSVDPFSLRRHALGIIRMLLAGTPIGVSKLIDHGLSSLPDGIAKDKATLKVDILSFIEGRVKNEFTSGGLSHDVVDAVLSAGFDNLPDAKLMAQALEQMKKEEYSENLSVTFKRAANIVKEHNSIAIDESKLTQESEHNLLAAISSCEKSVEELLKQKNFPQILAEVAALRTSLDSFFDSVMVMDEDDTIRNNRLGLLKRVVNLFARFADFSKLLFS